MTFLDAFTSFHVALSLVGIVSGFVVARGLLKSEPLNGWTAVFFITTVLTSLTGFGFPFHRVLPSHGVGIVSLLILAPAVLARYVYGLAGHWRWVYAVGVVLGFYLNFFVLVVQGFQKVPALQGLAPTQSEPPFAIVQGIVLVAFVLLTVAAARRFRPAG